MVLKIYGLSQSTCTRRVAVVCKELKIPYELINIDLRKGEHKSPEFLAKQPFGQVPAIDDDGFKLYESRAISRYLAAKVGSPLLPKQSDLQAFAKFEQAASVEYTNFDPSAATLTFEKVFKPMRGLSTDEAAASKLVETLNAKLDAYETILSQQKYLAGNEITLADLFHLPYGYMLDTHAGYDFFKTRPNVARWWKDISAREAWQSVKEGA